MRMTGRQVWNLPSKALSLSGFLPAGMKMDAMLYTYFTLT